MSPDAHAGVCLRSNLALPLSKRVGYKVVRDQWMMRWMVDGHMGPDVHADVCLRSNLALSERVGYKVVGHWWNCVVV